MIWNQTPVPTEAELSYTALGPALTRVTIEHRGWEALTDEQLAADCALPGGYNAGSYSAGWAQILGCPAARLPGCLAARLPRPIRLDRPSADQRSRPSRYGQAPGPDPDSGR
jgi:hypothetical protein